MLQRYIAHNLLPSAATRVDSVSRLSGGRKGLIVPPASVVSRYCTKQKFVNNLDKSYGYILFKRTERHLCRFPQKGELLREQATGGETMQGQRQCAFRPEF